MDLHDIDKSQEPGSRNRRAVDKRILGKLHSGTNHLRVCTHKVKRAKSADRSVYGYRCRRDAARIRLQSFCYLIRIGIDRAFVRTCFSLPDLPNT